MAYKIGAEDNIMAAYTCTPLVKIPVADLKPGAKVKGTTIAELGNRNNPLDMIVYTKGGKDYILMANSARGVMKIPTSDFGGAEAINARPAGETAGIKYETVKELTDVMQLDKLNDDNALILLKNGDLKTVLPLQLVFAPKGRLTIAQGASPGSRCEMDRSPEGAAQPRLCRPFGASHSCCRLTSPHGLAIATTAPRGEDRSPGNRAVRHHFFNCPSMNS